MELPVDTLIEIKTTEIDKIKSMDIALHRGKTDRIAAFL